MRSKRLSALSAGGASVALAALLSAGAAMPASAAGHASDESEPGRTCTETATGGSCLFELVSPSDAFIFTVPDEVKKVVIDVKASASGSHFDQSKFGDRVLATVPTTPGEDAVVELRAFWPLDLGGSKVTFLSGAERKYFAAGHAPGDPAESYATTPATIEDRVNAETGSVAITWSKPSNVPVPIDAGNGLTANVTASTGNVLVGSASGLTWDSAMQHQDRYDLGPGTTWGGASVDTSGGIALNLPGEGVFAYSQESNGLVGYKGSDRFEVRTASPGKVPAHGEIPEREYVFSLFRAADRATDYFNARGDIITSISSTGVRTDRLYNAYDPNRLVAFAEEGRVVTTVDYGPDEVEIRSGGAVTTRLVQSQGRVTEIVGSDGGRSAFRYHGGALAAIESRTSGGTVNVHFTWDSEDPKRVIQVTRDGEIVYEAP